MAELSHDMNGMQTHAALAKMFPDHKEILKGPPVGPCIYLHTHGARGDARRADTYTHRARRAAAGAADTHIPDKKGRRPARPIPTYPTRKKGLLLPYPI